MYDYTQNSYVGDKVAKEIKDLDYAFGIHPISGDIRKKNDVLAIKQSLKTLVLLNHYEKPFHPSIGCDIYKSLFEPFEGEFTKNIMRDNITSVTKNYEPRADVQNIDINIDEDNNSIGITIYFIPVGEIDTVSVDIFLRILR